MKEQQLRILKTMHQATSRMDLTMFAQAVDLSPNQAIEEVQDLAQAGFLQKVGNGYGLTEKGKNTLKIFTPAPSDKAFNFYVGMDKPLGFTAQSLEEFYRQVRKVCSDSLDFHLYRGDFEIWLREVLGDAPLAQEIEKLKEAELKGEDLRKIILKTIDAKYSIGELI